MALALAWLCHRHGQVFPISEPQFLMLANEEVDEMTVQCSTALAFRKTEDVNHASKTNTTSAPPQPLPQLVQVTLISYPDHSVAKLIQPHPLPLPHPSPEASRVMFPFKTQV